MKRSMKDKAIGMSHEVKGKIKETVGQVTDNPNLEVKGRVEKISGKVQKKIGQLEKVIED